MKLSKATIKSVLGVAWVLMMTPHISLADNSEATENKIEKHNLPEENTALYEGSFYNHGHWNTGNTDATNVPHWEKNIEEKDITTQWIPSPIGNIGFMHMPYKDGSQAIIFSGASHISKIRIDDGRFELVDQLLIPEFKGLFASSDEVKQLVKNLNENIMDESKWTKILSEYLSNKKQTQKEFLYGVYTFLDKDGNYWAVYGTSVYKVADKKTGDVNSKLEIKASLDLRKQLPKDKADTIDRLTGFSANYDGTAVVAMEGLVGVVSNDLTHLDYVLLDGEAVDNGVATDADGGIYLVTSKFMRKLKWDGKHLSKSEKEGAWKATYEWVHQPDITLSRGSGTTPTLMGFGDDEDKLVIIADAGKPVNVVAFWRNEIPADAKLVPGETTKRMAGKIPLSVDIQGTVEWSPHVYGYRTMVFNSTWPDPVPAKLMNKGSAIYYNVLGTGTTRKSTYGAEQFIWNEINNDFERSWKNESIPLTWTLSPVSSSSNSVVLASLHDGEYKMHRLNWLTGEQESVISLGKNHIFNSIGGVFVPMPNGDYYLTGMFGPVRISQK